MHLINFIFLALFAATSANYPLDFDEPVVQSDAADPTAYRLPEDLEPIHYVVEVTPYFEAEGTNAAFTFDGKVILRIKALRDALTSFVIHENVREIKDIRLTDANGVVINLDPYERIRQYHFLKVNLAGGRSLTKDAEYLLAVDYIGNINETPLSRGVFRGSYTGDDGRVRWYLATHLQPTNSRQAFPCFDEPGFKSTFDIIINRPASYGESYANMAMIHNATVGNRVREVFQTTPTMSAYLVSFHVSEDFTVLATNNNDTHPYRILGRPNAKGQGEYALEVGPPLTDWFSDYFQIPYYEMEPAIKNDQIASPYWASGATENWGLVTYRELRLLYEEGETNAVDKMSIATITAHELAHKWFGNLITCRWWDNVWINEGFASYFEYFAMDAVDKSLELEDQFNIMYVQSALSADQGASTRALQHTVNSPAEVTGHFSGISYSKGASLLLMLKHMLTENTFKKALQYFLQDRSYKHAFPSDLYQSFSRAVTEDSITVPNLNITNFMQYWVDERGYPLLDVNVNVQSGEMTLTQERFFINSSTSQTEQNWHIPLTYTTQSDSNWNNLSPSYVMTTKVHTLTKPAGDEWVVFNLQQKNIYRVNYDVDNWRLIAEALSSDPNSIHHLNRAQIVDDIFALMRAGKVTFENGFNVLNFLKNETSYYSWYPAITGFNWLRNRFLHLPEVSKEFDAILVEITDHAVQHLGYTVNPSEPLTTTLNRFHLLSFACNIGHEGCITNAEKQFRSLVNDGEHVNPNVRRHVLCTGLRAGRMDDFLFLRDLWRRSNNQAAELVLLRALGCTTNVVAGVEYLNMILTSEIKAQDSSNFLSFYYMGHPNNAKNALEWLKINYAAVRRAVVLPAWFNSALSNLAGYLDEEGLLNMENWLNENKELIPEYNSGISAINSARANKQWGTENAETILKAARGSAAIILPTTMVILAALLSLLFK